MKVCPICGSVLAICLVACTSVGMSPRERACLYGASANVLARVVEENGLAVSNADVVVYFSLAVREGKTAKGKSDANGGFRADGKTTGDVYVSVDKKGYYHSEVKIDLTAGETRNVNCGKWTPGEIVTNIVIRKVIKPVKLITPQWSKGFLIPQGGVAMGLDLEKQDWVKPWGNGEIADFEVMYKSDGKRRFEYSGASLKINFIRPFDGAYKSKLNKTSALQTIHQADTNLVYQNVFKFWEKRDGKRFIGESLSDDEYLVLRTRSRVDKEGKFVGGQYSMISGLMFGWSDKAFGAIRFRSHINPTFNDPNLEEMNIYNTPNFRTIGGLPKQQ